jgi:hypothetical protein
MMHLKHVSATVFLIGCNGGTDVETTTSTVPTTSITSTSTTTTTETAETGSYNTTTTTETGSTGNTPVDYQASGQVSFTSTSGSVSVSSCDLSYERFEPSAPVTDALVVLSHGFSRGTAQMTGWAEGLASWGFTVITPALCHSALWDTDHAQNAVDLQQLTDSLGFSRIIYAGHSAGGLASLLAGREDANTIGVIGLDLTDADNEGLSAASGLTAPFFGLYGESSDCNADNNGIDVGLSTQTAHLIRVTEADHCDFENETDWLCTTFCPSSNNTFSDEEIQQTVSSLFIAAAHAVAGLDDAQIHWWTNGGTYYDMLSSNGAISGL